MRFVAGLFFSCLFAFPVFAQDTEVEVTSVVIWVQAADRNGNLVSNLGPQDFFVFEDGVLVEPTCFEVPRTEPEPQPLGSRERLIVFLDLFNITPSEYSRVQPALGEFIQRVDPGKWDLFLAVLTREGRLGMIGPSADKDKLIGYLQNESGNAARDRELQEQRRDILQFIEVPNLPGSSFVPPGENFENVFASAYRLARAYANREKSVSEFSLAAFESLGDNLEKKGLAGHTSILYISGGFNVDPGRSYYDLIERAVSRYGLENNMAQRAVFTPQTNRESNLDLTLQIQNSIGKLNRSNITVYSLNTRGNLRTEDVSLYMQAGDRDPFLLQDYQDSLARIATDTGGTVFEDSNNYDAGLQRVAYDIGHRYVICYKAPSHKFNNEYHKIRVETKRDDVKLRYRRGYVD